MFLQLLAGDGVSKSLVAEAPAEFFEAAAGEARPPSPRGTQQVDRKGKRKAVDQDADGEEPEEVETGEEEELPLPVLLQPSVRGNGADQMKRSITGRPASGTHLDEQQMDVG